MTDYEGLFYGNDIAEINGEVEISGGEKGNPSTYETIS